MAAAQVAVTTVWQPVDSAPLSPARRRSKSDCFPMPLPRLGAQKSCACAPPHRSIASNEAGGRAPGVVDQLLRKSDSEVKLVPSGHRSDRGKKRRRLVGFGSAWEEKSRALFLRRDCGTHLSPRPCTVSGLHIPRELASCVLRATH